MESNILGVSLRFRDLLLKVTKKHFSDLLWNKIFVPKTQVYVDISAIYYFRKEKIFHTTILKIS